MADIADVDEVTVQNLYRYYDLEDVEGKNLVGSIYALGWRSDDLGHFLAAVGWEDAPNSNDAGDGSEGAAIAVAVLFGLVFGLPFVGAVWVGWALGLLAVGGVVWFAYLWWADARGEDRDHARRMIAWASQPPPARVTVPVAGHGPFVFSSDGSVFAALDGAALRRWQLQNGTELPPLRDCAGAAAVALGPAGSPVAVVRGGQIRLHAAAGRTMLPPVNAEHAEFGRDGALLAVSGVGYAELFTVADGASRGLHTVGGTWAPYLDFSPDGRWLAVNGSVGLTLIDTASNDVVTTPNAWHLGFDEAAAVAAARVDGTVRIVDMATQATLAVIPAPGNPTAAFGAGRSLLLALDSAVVRVPDFHSPGQRKVLRSVGQDDSVWLAPSARSFMIYTCEYDSDGDYNHDLSLVLDADSSRSVLVNSWCDRGGDSPACVFSPDGSALAIRRPGLQFDLSLIRVRDRRHSCSPEL